MKCIALFNLLFLLLLGAGPTHAADVEFESGSKQIQLLELYSSEGCSSCPPADAWFSTLLTNVGLWKTFVPIVFHVDYWDYLGWKDSLAKKEFTDRQLAYAREWGNDHVYTPGVILAGKEWTGWRNSNELPAKTRPEVGNLKLKQIEKNKFLISFTPIGPAKKNYKIYFAITGNGVSHAVAAGENKGSQLHHNFVVFEQKSGVSEKKDGAQTLTVTIENSSWKADRLAASAWVSAIDSLEAIQAVGGYLGGN